jgi:integrase/recombinase XerD
MTEIGIYFAISRLTHRRFGHVICPHLFRDSAATSIAIEDPEHVHVTRSILGHTTLQTSERHYVHAQSLEASRRYQRRILELRRKPPRRLEDR